MNLFKYQVFPALLFTMIPGMALGQVMAPRQQNNVIDGFTEPYRSIDVSATDMGTLSQVFVEEGDTVERGIVLANLNEEVLMASLAMAKEGRDAQGKLNAAIAELRLQQDRLAKLIGLQERRHASQVEVDRTQSQIRIAEAQVQAVQDELRIKALELKRIQAQLEQRRLRSPIDGLVTRVLKDEGEFVSANDPVVLQVVQLDPLLVIFSVPQNASQSIKAGQELPLQIGENQESAIGTVEFVSPTTDAQSGTCRVKVRIENPDNKWQSGKSCRLDTASIASKSSQPLSTIASN